MLPLLPTAEKRTRWWLNARFGMFIHWGLYSDSELDCWMKQIGEWVCRHADSIYGCEGEWHRPSLLPLPVTIRTIVRARLLDTGQSLRLEREPARNILHGLPARSPDPIAPVLELTVRTGRVKVPLSPV